MLRRAGKLVVILAALVVVAGDVAFDVVVG